MALVRVSGRLRKAGDRFFRAFGLTQAQFNVLMILRHESPEGCSQMELCRRLLVNGPDMSELARRMFRRGLLRREDHPRDERVWIIRLAPNGERLLDRVEPDYYRNIRKIMRTHSERQAVTLRNLLDRTERAIEEVA